MTATEDAKMKIESSPESPNKESRKSAKPIMEKKRRARINASLCELKALLLEVLKKEGSRHSKMEKADILEMTVKHLRNIQRQQFTAAVSSDPATLNKYHAGYSECATEVSRYLSTVDGVDVELRTRILNHLASRVQNTPTSQGLPVATAAPCLPAGIQRGYQISNVDIQNLTNAQGQTLHVGTQPQQNMQVSGGDQTKVFGGIQIVPARLPTGELSFVVPGNVLSNNNQIPSYVIPVYASPAVGSPSAPSNTNTPQTVTNTSPLQQVPVTPPRPQPTADKVLSISAPFLMLPNNVSPPQLFSTALSSPPPVIDRKQVWRPW